MSDTDIYLQWAVAAIVALVMLARGHLTLFHPTTVYLAFHVVVFCLRPTMVYFFGFDFVFRYMKLLPKVEDMQLALQVSSVGLVVFYLAFALASAGAARLEMGGRRELGDEDRKAFLLTAAIFVPLGLLSVFGANMKGERINGVFVMTGTSGYLNELQNVFVSVTILFILISRWRWWSYLPFGLYLVYRLGQGWGRWTVVLSFFLLVLVWLWDHRRKFPPLKFILPVPLLLIVFLNMSHDRTYFMRLLTGETTNRVTILDDRTDWRERWDTLDFANFDYLTYVVTVVPRKSKSYTYGTQYLQFFTEPIPRRLWKNKPAGPPIQLVDLHDKRYGNFTGLTVSLVGDGWMSGGWLGAIITMGIAGGSLGVAYRWFTRNQAVVHKACAFLIIDAMIVQFFRDGGISIFKFLLFSMAPLFVWAWLSERNRQIAAVVASRDELREARLRRMEGLPDDEAEESDENDEDYEDENLDRDWEQEPRHDEEPDDDDRDRRGPAR